MPRDCWRRLSPPITCHPLPEGRPDRRRRDRPEARGLPRRALQRRSQAERTVASGSLKRHDWADAGGDALLLRLVLFAAFKRRRSHGQPAFATPHTARRPVRAIATQPATRSAALMTTTGRRATTRPRSELPARGASFSPVHQALVRTARNSPSMRLRRSCRSWITPPVRRQHEPFRASDPDRPIAVTARLLGICSTAGCPSSSQPRQHKLSACGGVHRVSPVPTQERREIGLTAPTTPSTPDRPSGKTSQSFRNPHRSNPTRRGHTGPLRSKE